MKRRISRRAGWLTAPLAALAVVAAVSSPTGPAGAVALGGPGSGYSHFPAVAKIDAETGSCTGTFVAQYMMLTAKHCPTKNSVVYATEYGSDARRWIVTGRRDHPDDDMTMLWVVPDCCEGTELPDSPVQPLDFSPVAKDDAVTLVGYGYTYGPDPNEQPHGTNSQLAVTGTVTDSRGRFQVGGGAIVCKGDSGGPALRDGRLVGILTAGTKENASDLCGEGRYLRVEDQRAWIEDLIANWGGQ